MPLSAPSSSSISVIMPVLNEEAQIEGALQHLRKVEGLDELIVVDGGSADETVAMAQASGGSLVITSERGRASQMNAGARVARGDVLLFLHADVRLPLDAATWIRRAFAHHDVVGGAFQTWTVADGERPFWAPLLALADLRSRYTRLPYGDQAIFVRAQTFRKIGGFSNIELMEDLEFSRRLSAEGRIETAPASVRVSGRRFVARPIFYTFLINIFPVLFFLGVPPRVLHRIYGHVR